MGPCLHTYVGVIRGHYVDRIGNKDRRGAFLDLGDIREGDGKLEGKSVKMIKSSPRDLHLSPNQRCWH